MKRRTRPVPDDELFDDGTHHCLAADGLDLGYDGERIVSDLTVEVPQGKITVIVGANACGKSTLLRGLARLLKPRKGVVLLDGQSIHSMPTKQVATKLGILPQAPIAPEGITVSDLVARGRYPHQRWYRQWGRHDEEIIEHALEATNTTDLASRSVDELSGGQRQRVWIAMALAQQTDIMLLDEPTTYLDLAHQIDVLDLLVDLNLEHGRTIVLVLHDLNQACRYAHHLIAMHRGQIVATGPPSEVVTEELVHEVFSLRSKIVHDPVSQTPMVLPIGRHVNITDAASHSARAVTPAPSAGADISDVIREDVRTA